VKIGVIVHSFTGHTLAVAQKMADAFARAGHTVTLERVTVQDEKATTTSPVILSAAPEAAGYDLVLFGSPVWGFSITPGMKTYLAQISPLQGGKTACFVTHQLPYPWMGANRALRQMQTAIAAKGGVTLATGSVTWTDKQQETQTDRLVNSMLDVVTRQAEKVNRGKGSVK
jgi:NAD(P)H-dependent FMN reductase